MDASLLGIVRVLWKFVLRRGTELEMEFFESLPGFNLQYFITISFQSFEFGLGSNLPICLPGPWMSHIVHSSPLNPMY
jgi:hypothetical protein